MDKDFDIDSIANEARYSIGDYCINECKAYCCRKGHLLLSESELKTTFLDNEELIKKNQEFITSVSEDKFALDLSRNNKGCPSLDENNLCKIHKHSNRSNTCHEFPIFIKDKEIFISQRCFAHKDNKFYSFIYSVTAKGYKIVNENPFTNEEQ